MYGSVLLHGAIATTQHDERGTVHDMLAEATDAARRVGTDANLGPGSFQWGRYEQAYAALRAAPRPHRRKSPHALSVRTLRRNLAALAPPGIRRDAGQIGASR